MAETQTAEEFAQRALDVAVLEPRELQTAWGEMGSRNVSVEELQQALVRSGVLTNYQLERLRAGYSDGYVYGDYKVLYLVGTGTFARVYRAVHRETGQVFAVKVLRKRYSNEREGKEAQETIERFRREGEMGQTLQHPNIVAIHEVYSKGTTHFLVMDFVEGRNLRDFVKIRSKFDPLEATRLMIGVASGLAFAYQKGITHRDLKLSNILVSSDGEAKLVDFGLAAQELEGSDSESFTNPRTVDYAGLERATGVRKDDTRSDIFFAGCIYYQLLAGKPALAETRERMQRLSKTRYEAVRPVQEVEPSVPLPLALVANKAIEFDPEKRFQTPAEFLTELKLVLKRIEEGDGAARKSQRKLDSREGQDETGKARTIMIVESDHKLQDILRELFKRNGYRALVTRNPQRVDQQFYENPQAADVVLFSSGNLGDIALQKFNAFGKHPSGQEIPALLLLGESQREWIDQAETAEHRTVAVMPMKLRELRAQIVELLNVNNSDGED